MAYFPPVNPLVIIWTIFNLGVLIEDYFIFLSHSKYYTFSNGLEFNVAHEHIDSFVGNANVLRMGKLL